MTSLPSNHQWCITQISLNAYHNLFFDPGISTMLTEIDQLEVHVIVNDELDPISPSPNPAVQVASRFMGIPLSPLDSNTERGGAQMEMRMDNICCAAHGISLLLVKFSIAARIFLQNYGRKLTMSDRLPPRATRNTTSSLTLGQRVRCGREIPVAFGLRLAR